VPSSSIQPFGHNKYWPKIFGGSAPFLGREGLGPHLRQSALGGGLPPYQVTSWCIQQFGHNRNWPKIWEGATPPFWGKRRGVPSNTKSPGPRPTSIPSGSLIHAAIWPQPIWCENWGEGLCPFWEGELGPHLTQCGQCRGLSARQVSS